MEPRIINGHRYLCKKTVIMKGDKGRQEEAYTKGKVYPCQLEYPYPEVKDTHNKYPELSAGFITDNDGNAHPWPYDPEHHPWCHDRWTHYFEDVTA